MQTTRIRYALPFNPLGKVQVIIPEGEIAGFAMVYELRLVGLLKFPLASLN